MTGAGLLRAPALPGASTGPGGLATGRGSGGGGLSAHGLADALGARVRMNQRPVTQHLGQNSARGYQITGSKLRQIHNRQHRPRLVVSKLLFYERRRFIGGGATESLFAG